MFTCNKIKQNISDFLKLIRIDKWIEINKFQIHICKAKLWYFMHNLSIHVKTFRICMIFCWVFLKSVLLNIPLANFFFIVSSIAWRWRVKIKIFSAEVNLNIIKLQHRSEVLNHLSISPIFFNLLKKTHRVITALQLVKYISYIFG